MAFTQDMESPNARLELRSSIASFSCQKPSATRLEALRSTNHYSHCTRFFGSPSPERFNFSEKYPDFSLRQIPDVASLRQQGGSRLFQAANTIPLVSKALSMEIEMVYRDPFLSTNSTSSSTTQLGTQVVLKGSRKAMTYRAEYGYIGQDTGTVLSLAPTDRMGGKLQWEWQLPYVTPKVELSRLTDNVAQDPTRHQTLATRQHYSLDWTIPDWPRMIFSYGREQKDVSTWSGGSRSDTTFIEKVSTKLAFTRSQGQGEWVSRFTTFQNDLRDRTTREELHSMLKGKFSLFKPVDFSPGIGFTRQTNAKQGFSQKRLFANLETQIRFSKGQSLQPSVKWTRIGTQGEASNSEMLFSKLQYTYDPFDHSYSIAISGQYALSQIAQQSHSPESYGMTLFVQKDLQDLLQLPHQQQFLSLKFTHHQQISTWSSQFPRPNSTAMVLLRMTS